MPSLYELRFEDRAAALSFLQSLRDRGFLAIAGVDECGRGPVAGPVVAGCVLLPLDHEIVGIRDSKKLSEKRRKDLSAQITQKALSYGIGVCESEVVDRLNIRRATHVAARRAVEQCLSRALIEYLLCDGGLDLRETLLFPSNAIIKGDDLFECIGAASIVAKVYRDEQMAIYHGIWPEYGFDKNRGYGTAGHLAAIEKYGITPIHRRSFGVCRTAKERVDGLAGQAY